MIFASHCACTPKFVIVTRPRLRLSRRSGDDEVLVTFETPQRAITPGQAVVFYDGDAVVGGGWIC